MRELNFRVWDGNQMHNCVSISPFNITDCDRRLWKKNEVMVMQSIGLKDKSAKEIYEGDIVKFLGGGIFATELTQRIGEVKWNDELLKFDVFCNNEPIPDLRKSYDDNKFEVIGNIYESPHLLNVEQNHERIVETTAK